MNRFDRINNLGTVIFGWYRELADGIRAEYDSNFMKIGVLQNMLGRDRDAMFDPITQTRYLTMRSELNFYVWSRFGPTKELRISYPRIYKLNENGFRAPRVESIKIDYLNLDLVIMGAAEHETNIHKILFEDKVRRLIQDHHHVFDFPEHYRNPNHEVSVYRSLAGVCKYATY